MTVGGASNESGNFREAICCFCYGVIDRDVNAMRIMIGPLRDETKYRQLLFAHAACFKDRIHSEIELWWEFE